MGRGTDGVREFVGDLDIGCHPLDGIVCLVENIDMPPTDSLLQGNTMEPIVDLSFPVLSQVELPADHHYTLFASLCRTIPELHGNDGFAVHPLAGRIVGPRMMQLCDWSRLTIRCHANSIAILLPLAGKQLSLGDRRIQIGIPQVHGLIPSSTLRSRLVTTKNGHELERFRSEVRRQLEALKVQVASVLMEEERRNRLETPTAAVVTIGKRRTLRIKDKEVVGYELLIEALSAEESLIIQQIGIGGRRHLGCGVFVGISC